MYAKHIEEKHPELKLVEEEDKKEEEKSIHSVLPVINPDDPVWEWAKVPTIHENGELEFNKIFFENENEIQWDK